MLKDNLGIRPRKGKLLVGDWELDDVIDECEAYQDWLAHHRDLASTKMRARVYLVPEQTSVERRQQLRRAADREAQLLFDVREHPNILQITNYSTDAPLGPTVFFQAFDGAPLYAFLRHHPDLTFLQRVEIVRQVGLALAYCHGRRIIHGALCPQSVLVRQDEQGGIVTRLFNFQLGRGENVTSTLHATSLVAEPWLVYQAPEVSEDPNLRGLESDLFSLGALAYFVLTGQPPAPNRAALLERLERDGHLDPLAVNDGIPTDGAECGKSVVTLIEDATKRHRHLPWRRRRRVGGAPLRGRDCAAAAHADAGDRSPPGAPR
ncbi:MAG: protein kinase [Polyangiaceae bacterium]|nr:protein kinase [Polyangiaceae bacterium]